MEGKCVIVRSRDAGVHAGILKSHDGPEVVLTKARRLWYWVCAKGDFLSGVARHGINASRSKIGGELDEHWVGGVCEVIPVADGAAESIRTAREYRGDE